MNENQSTNDVVSKKVLARSSRLTTRCLVLHVWLAMELGLDDIHIHCKSREVLGDPCRFVISTRDFNRTNLSKESLSTWIYSDINKTLRPRDDRRLYLINELLDVHSKRLLWYWAYTFCQHLRWYIRLLFFTSETRSSVEYQHPLPKFKQLGFGSSLRRIVSTGF